MRIALIGNQNSGKTSLFNLLTGTNQKVGNWPGVTIERKSGILRTTEHEIIDLPGIYSLSPFSPEEAIVRKFLIEEKVDLIINILDSTSIERSLYLTTQLFDFNIPMILALNMTDLAFEQGIRINVDLLSEKLGLPIVPISALKRTGIKELISIIKNHQLETDKFPTIYEGELLKTIIEVEDNILMNEKRFLAVKLLENDQSLPIRIELNVDKEIKHLENNYENDIPQVIADQRYNYVENIRDQTVSSLENPRTLTDKIDRIILNKYLAIPIFILIMFGVYFLSAGPVGSGLSGLIEELFAMLSVQFSAFLTNVGASPWAVSLMIDGIVNGVTAILSFVPQLLILFLLIAFLEASGYMSRIGFFFDRIFRRVGLSGKALIPFIIGSGCSVPAIMATRTINDENERRLTILLTPFIPCSAKLPIITLFAGYFFKDSIGLVSASLYFLAIVVILVTALTMKRFMKGAGYSAFIQELPTYKAPNLTYVLKTTWEKTWAFITRAGSIIFLASIIIWLLLSFNWTFTYGVPIEESILSDIGRLFSWVFYPFLGTNSWAAAVSIIQGLVAKEQVITSLSIIAGLSGEAGEAHTIFTSPLFSFFTPASAYAFMAFNLFSAPCFGAIGAMHKEFGSGWKMLKAVAIQTLVAFLIATIIYQTGTLIGGLL
ncbi:MAG: ferrous iron transport protein B [Bacilli bacterium]|nr:ferrous iron transport protein B [Bacilli bacterium]